MDALAGIILGFLLGRATGGVGPSVPWPTGGGGQPPPPGGGGKAPPPPGGGGSQGKPPVTIPPFPTKGPSGLPIPQPQTLFPVANLWPMPVAPTTQPQPQPQPAAARMTYTIANGDTAVAVAQRFNGGQTKRADGRWIWKELDQAVPALETTGPVPVPWTVGATLVLPPLWTADSGPRTGAKGQVGSSVSGYSPDEQLITV